MTLTGSGHDVSNMRRTRNTPSARAWTYWAQSSKSSSWRPSAGMRWTRPTGGQTCPTPPAEPLNGAAAEAGSAHTDGRERDRTSATASARANTPADARGSAPTDAREGAPADARENAPTDAREGAPMDAPDGATAPRDEGLARARTTSGHPVEPATNGDPPPGTPVGTITRHTRDIRDARNIESATPGLGGEPRPDHR